ncbi:MAG: hypothetical protein UIH27_13705 [Ruminococcus sp.]|nr:hypothetical protein [Ruminococcus sp.]
MKRNHFTIMHSETAFRCLLLAKQNNRYEETLSARNGMPSACHPVRHTALRALGTTEHRVYMRGEEGAAFLRI